MYDPQKRPVRIVVHDKSKHESRTFTCEVEVLRSSMVYFSSVLDQLLEVADRSSTTPLSLNVNCDIPIFAWLMEYVQSRQPEILPSNVVSLILSSNFLMMDSLYQEGLRYLKEHLAEVLLTDVNMDCIPQDTVVKLAALMREEEAAKALWTLLQSGSEKSANRGFLAVLLKHIVMRACDDPASLRWCSLCGILVDVEAMKTINGLSMHEVPCPQLGAGRVGARGEVLRSHEALVPVTDTLLSSIINQSSTSALGGSVAISSSFASTPSSPLGVAQSLTNAAGGATPISLTMEGSEAISWRVVGCCRFFRCERCDTCVHLIHIASHVCLQTPPTTAQFQSSIRTADDVFLIRLFLEGGLSASLAPIRRPIGNVAALAVAVSAAANNFDLSVGGGGAGINATGSAGAVGSNSSNSTDGTNNPNEDPNIIAWKLNCLSTKQSMAGDGTPQVEMIRFFENKMMAELTQRLQQLAPPNPVAGGKSTGARGSASGSGPGGIHRAHTFGAKGFHRGNPSTGGTAGLQRSGSSSFRSGRTKPSVGR